jgi:GAF domain-containing protein
MERDFGYRSDRVTSVSIFGGDDSRMAAMPDQELFVLALSDFAHTLVGDFAAIDVLHDLSMRVTEVFGVSGAGVSLADNGSIRFVTAIDELTTAIERLQENHQEGPCVEAHRTGHAVVVGDLRQNPERWPKLGPKAVELGVVSVVGIPMHLNGTRLGALNIYDTAPRDWTPRDVAAAQVLANMATGFVAHASELERERRTSEQLGEALQSRIVIEQAKGMLAAERKITVDEAFVILREHARANNASLHAVAEAIVTLGLRP